MMGYTEGELRDGGWKEITHPEDMVKSNRFVQDLLAGRNRRPLRKRYITKKGAVVRAEIYSNLVRNDEGNPEFFITYVRDIGDRYQYETKLKQQAETFCALVKGSLDGFWILDPHTTKIVTVNESYCSMMGYEPDELVGHPIHLIEVRGGERNCQLRMEFLVQNGNDRFRTAHRHKDGRDIPVEISGQYLPANDQILCFIRDITEDIKYQAKMEETVRRRTRDLESSNAALESFAYAASHDLREPLNKVKAFTARLSDKYSEQLDERGQEYLKILDSAAGRMSLLIEDLLVYSRARKMEETFVDVSVNTILDDVQVDLELSIQEAQAEFDIQENMPRVSGHYSRFKQVFQNLVSNAIKFRKPDQPAKVRVRGEKKGTEVIYTVSDDGIGFRPEDTKRIFIMFTRLHSRFEYPGTGIGLALCRRIVELYGGTIEAKGEPDAGATFTIRLPVGGTDE